MNACRILALAAALLSILAPAAGFAAEPNWPSSMLIATASPGGTYHVYGMGLAKLLTRTLGVSAAELPTEGPSENAKLVESGAAQIGFVTMAAAYQGWNGTGEWTGGQPLRAIRAVFPMYDTPFTFAVRKDSPIRTLAGMTGKRIGAGPQAGTAGYYVPNFLSILKISSTFAYGSYDQLARQLQDGTIDVLAAAAGAPFPALAALDARKQIRFVSLGVSDVVALRLAQPELGTSIIPAGSYPSLMKDYATVGLFNFAIVHKSLPEDLVYAIVNSVFSNHEELVAVHSAAAATIPENFSRNTFLPLHPGAMRYYADKMTKGVVRGD